MLPAITMLLAVAFVSDACRDGGAASPTPTTAPRPTAPAAAPAPTATPDPIASTEVDAERIFSHVAYLSKTIGARVSGTEAEEATRDFLVATLESYGYDVTVQDFEYTSLGLATVTVTAGTVTVTGVAMRGSADAQVTAPLVRAGIGRADEMPATAAGAIVLVERGDLTFLEKAQNAQAAGAAAVLIYNNEPEPLSGTLGAAVTIPVAGIEADAAPLLLAETAGGASVTISASTAAGGTALNVIAKPRGVDVCETVTGGHHDTVPGVPGASDNASGTASVLEVARVRAARGDLRADCFALFGAEEWGLHGSAAFVNALSADERAALRLMINLDVVGVSTPLQLIGSPDATAQARVLAGQLGIEASLSELANGLGSDHLNFQRVGVPVVMLYRADDLIHTVQDDISRIRPESLGQAVTLALAILAALDAG